jgi:hypothetical protein
VRYVVGDAHLQQAIDKLTRVSKQFVDYRDLAERHLGTIYEGLLEYRLLPDDSEEGGQSCFSTIRASGTPRAATIHPTTS